MQAKFHSCIFFWLSTRPVFWSNEGLQDYQPAICDFVRLCQISPVNYRHLNWSLARMGLATASSAGWSRLARLQVFRWLALPGHSGSLYKQRAPWLTECESNLSLSHPTLQRQYATAEEEWLHKARMMQHSCCPPSWWCLVWSADSRLALGRRAVLAIFLALHTASEFLGCFDRTLIFTIDS